MCPQCAGWTVSPGAVDHGAGASGGISWRIFTRWRFTSARSAVTTGNRRTDAPQPDDCYIGRPSPLGNPFVLGRDSDRAEVIGSAGFAVLLRRQSLRATARLRPPAWSSALAVITGRRRTTAAWGDSGR